MPRREDIHTLSAADREFLVRTMLSYINDSIVLAHSHFMHNPDRTFFTDHRTLIEGMERHLASNGAGRFVPLPKWDPHTPIPSEFNVVKDRDDGRPQPRGPLWNLDPNRPTPAELVSPRVCDFRAAEDFARALNGWHGDVHTTVGGTMSDIESSPAAPIFWCWHAFVDDLFEDYQQCDPTRISSTLPSLGGIILGSPNIARNADGRLEIFGVGTDNRIWHIWQTATNNGWSGWAQLGDHQVVGKPSIILTQDNRLELFVRGRDRSIWHIYQTAPSNGWSGWENLGGGWSSDPAVAMNQDGRLEVFARALDNVIGHRNQMWAGGWWSPTWGRLGDNMMGSPTVGRNADGRLEFFIRRNDGVMMHRWQEWPGGRWSALREFGGGVGAGDPVVLSLSNGSLEVFVRGTDAALWHIWQTAPSNGWSGWQSLDGVFPPNTVPAVTRNAAGGIDVFMRGLDNAISHNWYTSAEPWWVGWSPFGGFILNDPAVGLNLDNRMEVIARGSNMSLVHRWQPW